MQTATCSLSTHTHTHTYGEEATEMKARKQSGIWAFWVLAIGFPSADTNRCTRHGEQEVVTRFLNEPVQFTIDSLFVFPSVSYSAGKETRGHPTHIMAHERNEIPRRPKRMLRLLETISSRADLITLSHRYTYRYFLASPVCAPLVGQRKCREYSERETREGKLSYLARRPAVLWLGLSNKRNGTASG